MRWRSSLDADAYRASVAEIRERIAAGTVYQANLCRVLEHDLDESADLDGLDALLREGNPAPYAGRIRVAAAGLDVVSASPERFLSRSGERLVSSPIKGTATTADRLLPKDVAENVMIVDLVRNDLSRVCHEGTVDVEALCAVEPHPGPGAPRLDGGRPAAPGRRLGRHPRRRRSRRVRCPARRSPAR